MNYSSHSTQRNHTFGQDLAYLIVHLLPRFFTYAILKCFFNQLNVLNKRQKSVTARAVTLSTFRLNPFSYSGECFKQSIYKIMLKILEFGTIYVGQMFFFLDFEFIPPQAKEQFTMIPQCFGVACIIVLFYANCLIRVNLSCIQDTADTRFIEP